MNNSVQQRNSRYVQGGKTEIGPVGLEVWERYQFPRDDSDRHYIIEKKFENRVDLIANEFYGDWRLWWVICQYNNILDPHNEIAEGSFLLIPSKDRINLLFNKTGGGVETTRENEAIISTVVL